MFCELKKDEEEELGWSTGRVMTAVSYLIRKAFRSLTTSISRVRRAAHADLFRGINLS